MATLSPSEHLQEPVEFRFPFRHEQPKVVHLLLQLYWTMYSHAFGTGGSIESLATRCPLSTFQPKYVGGGIWGLSLSRCRISSSSYQSGTTYRRIILHIEPWTLWGLLLQGAEVAYVLWRPCFMPFSWCGQKSRRQCHNRLLRGKGEELRTPIQGMKISVWFHVLESISAAWTYKGGFNPGTLDCESAILPLS